VSGCGGSGGRSAWWKENPGRAESDSATLLENLAVQNLAVQLVNIIVKSWLCCGCIAPAISSAEN
jgi:hypothetical protein